ncbi:MAG: divalent metal cation transporter [Luteolibacter sp.]
MTPEKETQLLSEAADSGFFGKFSIYFRMSGPGWVQAAVTLGGGSLVGALYLGVIGGYQFMWLQPLAMLCGIIMLAAISHVTLSSKDRPFVAAKKNVSPTLAWGWLIATMIANIVFCSAQFALGTDAAQNNLGILPKLPYAVTALFAIGALTLLWLSRQKGKASKIIDHVLKGLVALVVLAFMGVVIVLAAKGGVNWGALFSGLVPDFSALFKPASTYAGAISATGENSDFWTSFIANNQRNVIIGAFGSAVGINMTFLLPYSLKAKGWGKKHRELSRYDLLLGLFVPFILATSFLVIATSSQFHAKKDGVHSQASYEKVVDKLLTKTDLAFADLSDEAKAAARENLPQADKDLGVMLASRNAKDLATSLEPFLGKNAQLIFGIGVLAMAVSTMIVHMMMNGYVISEAFGKPGQTGLFMLGAAMPALTGFLSPILWDGQAKTAIVVPAAVIATTLLPIAYIIFLLLMNSKKTLGEDMPQKRSLVNILMIIAAGIATFASIWSLVGKYNSPAPYEHYFGLTGLIVLPILAIVGITGFVKRNRI